MLAIPPIPEISISLASPQEPESEPFSPFSPSFSKNQPLVEDDDGWRATLLSPPPMLSPRNLSPLRPVDSVRGRGLERERFEALLRASRERNVGLGAKKPMDLRKEIAIKAHKSKQVERRALFLSKVQAPPSPTATLTPKTPPESPAIFHYTLPSPGLDSPIAMFESLSQHQRNAPVREPWVEQVEFRLASHAAHDTPLKSAPVFSKRKPLPSLDQITARLGSHVAGPVSKSRSPSRASARLPAFLQSGRQSPPGQAPQLIQIDPVPVAQARRPPPTAVGRLQFPTRSARTAEFPKITIREPKPCLPPASPTLSPPPGLEVTTTLVPRTATTSPTQITESNLLALNASLASREDTARKMLTRLRRRTLPPTAATSDIVGFSPQEEHERKLRRRSAPPELQEMGRSGFSHPVLALPGAF
ncbi:uncharacterized protein LAESUDRAFT_758991 [Laetiporus sulphureus 93-53]|uniref:Uncharacterized protein n=1 Tax=Laetiporus sulphureus 93-53 TaxID=1314785 RepID=A0A165EDM9_9APHY|nr:uncharacterized protein LAESUDRAFT_758991 [Laetiporus sulphureus 93-53]KZT06813.1 hypothetical protein LAESUDRAFT_758991 [Laetiporus sulphureus 93-53]